MLAKFVALLFFVTGAIAQSLPPGEYLISSANRDGYVSADSLGAPIFLQNPHRPGPEAQWSVFGPGHGHYSFFNEKLRALANVWKPAPGDPVLTNQETGNIFLIEQVPVDENEPPRYTIKVVRPGNSTLAWTLKPDLGITIETEDDILDVQQWLFTGINATSESSDVLDVQQQLLTAPSSDI